MRDQIEVTEPIYNYLLSVSLREPPVLSKLREETGKLERSFWQISSMQGQFMGVLVKLMGAKRILEVGTFTGYSALVMALALPEDGEIIALDIDKDYTDIAQRYWKEAGVDGKIDLRLAPAVESMDALLDAGEADGFDMCFIDADKSNYINYYERALKLVKPGGLVLIDNTLFSGRPVGIGLEGLADWQLEWTEAVKEFNEYVKKDDRVTLAMIPVGDGMTFAIREK